MGDADAPVSVVSRRKKGHTEALFSSGDHGSRGDEEGDADAPVSLGLSPTTPSSEEEPRSCAREKIVPFNIGCTKLPT